MSDPSRFDEDFVGNAVNVLLTGRTRKDGSGYLRLYVLTKRGDPVMMTEWPLSGSTVPPAMLEDIVAKLGQEATLQCVANIGVGEQMFPEG